ncbi:hypothetical protein MishRS11D_08520 [Methylomagnum ishizawai]|nr:hypothetical protein MishRS11D_08520 [Methylomagnum ishizawai]
MERAPEAVVPGVITGVPLTEVGSFSLHVIVVLVLPGVAVNVTVGLLVVPPTALVVQPDSVPEY